MPNPFPPHSSFISNWDTPDQNMVPTHQGNIVGMSAGLYHLLLPLPQFSVVPAPFPLCWQIDQFEVSAFFLTSICKHLFMGFLLMHSILEKAKSTTFLKKFKFLEKQGGGEEEGVLTWQTVFKIFCTRSPLRSCPLNSHHFAVRSECFFWL